MTSSGQASDAASAKITRSSGEKSSPVICAGKTDDPFFGSGVVLAPESQRNYHYPSCLILLLNRLVILINRLTFHLTKKSGATIWMRLRIWYILHSLSSFLHWNSQRPFRLSCETTGITLDQRKGIVHQLAGPRDPHRSHATGLLCSERWVTYTFFFYEDSMISIRIFYDLYWFMAICNDTLASQEKLGSSKYM